MMRKVAGKKKFVFQQDEAPAHMANKMQVFLKKTLTFGPSQCGLPRAQTLTSWTTVCGGEWRVVHVRFSQNVEELKACITKNWANLDKGYIVRMVKSINKQVPTDLFRPY